VSGGDDRTVRVWDATTGLEVARMLHDSAVNSAVFSADGKYVVSGSDDQTVRIWDWKIEELVSKACSHLMRNLTRLEWEKYLPPDQPYPTRQADAACPQWQIEPEALPSSSPTP